MIFENMKTHVTSLCMCYNKTINNKLNIRIYKLNINKKIRAISQKAYYNRTTNYKLT